MKIDCCLCDFLFGNTKLTNGYDEPIYVSDGKL